MTRLLSVPAGRTGKWVVVGVWLVLLAALLGSGAVSGFEGAQKNESASFLPGSAESTRVLEITKQLRGGETAETVIVYHRDGGLTAADLRTIEADVARLNTLRFRNTTPFANPAAPTGPPYELSQDRSTALVLNTITGDGESETLTDPIDRYRELVSGDRAGLEAEVGGPAGISADAIKIFEQINGTLLLAALGLVFVLLALIYRSPFFLWFPLLSVVVGEIVVRGVGYGLTQIGVTVNGQSSSILSVLVLGAGTDYALLLVARYREELRVRDDRHEAMALALRTAGPAIIASALTVSVTLLSLTLAKVNGTAGLGPIGAMGIIVALFAQLTLLPAVLVIVGRKPFWPFVPHVGDAGVDETHGRWRRLGERVAANPRRIWITTTVVLGVCCLGLLNFSDGLTQGNSFRNDPESLAAQALAAQGFPAGSTAPTEIVVPDASRVPAVVASVGRVPGVAGVRPTGERGEDGVIVAAALRDDPYSTEAYAIVPRIRAAAVAAAPGALVGGPTAVEVDLRDASADDTRLLVPLALLIVFLILAALLRAVVAPILLILTVVLSFAASLGVAAVLWDVLLGLPGSDPSVPLFAFIFLVALGVDYNIFLMARVREEAARFGTRPGTLRGIAVTGGVITSAGVVLAGTFAVLGVLPITFLTEIGTVVAFGVLLDTFVVRSVLVPALVFDLGPRVWWPGRLSRVADAPQDEAATPPAATP